MGRKKRGKAAAMTIKRVYGDDFFKRIGKSGGHNSHKSGFYANRELARRAGAIGGRNSQWNKKLIKTISARADEGAILVYDRKIGLVKQQAV